FATLHPPQSILVPYTTLFRSRSAVPEDRNDWKNFRFPVDRRRGSDALADLGRPAALQREAGLRFSRGSLCFFQFVVRRAWIGNDQHGLQLLGLLQYLSSRRRDSQSREEHSSRNLPFRGRHCSPVFGDADEYSRRRAVA